jgi:hypothetical protein
MKSVYQRDTNIPMFMSALFIIAMWWNQSRCPTVKGERIYIYVCI